MSDLQSLNLDDLEIEQLEQRIELGLMIPNPTTCATNSCNDFTGNGWCGANKCITNT